MVPMLRKILIIITISQLVNATVKWELVTKPIVFSKDVTLKCCNSQENICRPGGRKWKGGPDKKLLIFDEGPVNKTKYGSECVEDGFTLTIKYFDLEDFNQYYTCSYGFEQYGANLSTDNYEIHPMTSTFNISDIVSGTIASIDVHFLKIYPFPQCFLQLDKDVRIKPQKVFQNFTSYFYSGIITFEYKLMEEGCGQNLSIVCRDASNNTIQLPYNTLLKQCLGSKEGIGILVVVVCILVSLVLVGGFLFFLYKKMPRKPKKDKQNFDNVIHDDFQSSGHSMSKNSLRTARSEQNGSIVGEIDVSIEADDLLRSKRSGCDV